MSLMPPPPRIQKTPILAHKECSSPRSPSALPEPGLLTLNKHLGESLCRAHLVGDPAMVAT